MQVFPSFVAKAETVFAQFNMQNHRLGQEKKNVVLPSATDPIQK